MSEETSPVTSPTSPPVSEPQGPAQSLSQSQSMRTEESERPAEQQPSLDVPPEPSKAPLHVPMSNVILESVPIGHISASLPAGGIRIAFFIASLMFPLETTPDICCSPLTVQYQLLHPQSNYHSKSLWRFLFQ